MENAITHVLFAAAVLCLFRFGAQGRIGWFALPLLFLASISRVESGFHIFPLLMVFSIYWLIVHRSFKAVWFSAGVFGLWLLFNGWRYLYFGDWVPNTGPAQGISLSARLNALQSLDANYLADSVWHGKEILRRNGALYLLLLAPLAFLVDWKRHWTLLTLLALCSIVTAFIYPFAFGPTRIDYPRTNTSLALIVWLTVLYFAARVQTTKVTGARGNLLGLALALIIAFALPQSYRSPYILGWSTGGFESYRREFARAAAAHDLGTATVSNVDLGAISWYKQFNIVDLGGLGSKTMTAVPYGPLMSEYWFELAAPDLLETRPYWSCVFQDRIFKDARFSARYTPLREEFPEHSVARCAGQQLPRGVYIRRDVMQGADSAERRFIDALQRQPTLQVIADELAACVSLQAAGAQQAADTLQAAGASQSADSTSVADGTSQGASARDPYACAYIARAVYREKPRLLESSSAAELAALFESSPTAAFDAFLIKGHADNGAYKPAILALFDLLVESKGMQQVGADGGFTVYANRRFIAYRNTQCTAADYRNPFYLHIHADADSPDHYNIGSRMSTHGFRSGTTCIAAQRLPAEGVARITTGQWNPVAQNFAWQITFLP